MRPVLVQSQLIEAAILFASFAALPFNGVLALKRLLLLALVLCAAHRMWINRHLPAIPLATLTWFGLAVISLLWTADPGLTARELPPDLIYPFLAFTAATTLCTERTNFRAGLLGLLVGVALAVGLGSIAAYRAGGFAHYDWYSLAHGYGQFSTVLVLALPFALTTLAQAIHKRQLPAAGLHLLVLAAIFVGGYATHVRMFWLAAAIVVVSVVILIVRHPAFSRYRKWATVLLTTGMIGMVPVYLAVARLKPANYLNTQPGGENSIAAAFTQNERFEMWRFWLERIADHPWLGIGFGHSLPMHTYRELKPAHWFDMMFAHAHNMLLDIAVQLGWGGLAVFTAALLALLLRFWRAARHEDIDIALAGIAGIGLVMAILAKNMTDDYFSRGPLFAFWILAGLVLARAEKVGKA